MRLPSVLSIILNLLLLVEINVHATLDKLMVHGRSKLGHVPPPISSEATKAPGDSYRRVFAQRFDHFDNSNSDVWLENYWVNQQWYQPGGPIFLLLGGEGPESYLWVTNAQNHTIATLAIKYSATLMALEHRYYGSSRPTSNQTVENLKWLSSRQALADAAVFIQSMNVLYNWTNPQWVVFGGSYAGALAAWMRQLYPNLVGGAIASSGPVLAKLDFQEYVEVVQNSLRAFSTDCANNIQTGFVQLQSLMQTSSGRANLTNTFNLCPPFGDVPPNQRDVTNFYDTIMGNFQFAVQYSQDNVGYFANQFNIPVVCGLMNNDSRSYVDRLADVNRLVFTYFGTPGQCTRTNYTEFIQCMLDPSFDAPCARSRSWTWQTCTEFGYFQSTDTADNIFGNTVPLSFYVDLCTEIFGPQYNQAFVGQAIDCTNNFYGGRDNYKGTNVVLPNGSVDPWHALGILNETLNSAATAAFVNGTAHCADMYEPRDLDPLGLTIARATIDQSIAKWLAAANQPPATTPGGGGAASVTVASSAVFLIFGLLFV